MRTTKAIEELAKDENFFLLAEDYHLESERYMELYNGFSVLSNMTEAMTVILRELLESYHKKKVDEDKAYSLGYRIDDMIEVYLHRIEKEGEA